MRVSERIIRGDGIEIATEAFGDPVHPPVILIMGGMASMLWWPEEFCCRLAAVGHFVIRYDQRDSGLSTKYPPGRPGYGYDDAVDDAFRVLDGYGITAAHFAGFSQGGVVGQGAALKHPERVLSLTAISSSPAGLDWSSFPESGQAWLEHMTVNVDWSDRTEAVAYLVEDARLVAGTAHPFSEAGTRAFIERDFDRSGGYASATNHAVLFEIDKAWRGRLGELHAPLLVIHGTADPVFPVEHGIALADAVAGAKLLRLEGGGHELHPGHWDRIIAAIAEHIAGARCQPQSTDSPDFQLDLPRSREKEKDLQRESMSLKLYYHPLASFCWKPLIALYENHTPFEPIVVDLMDETSAAAFRAVWPMAKFPVIRDDARNRTVAESSIVIEYLDAFYPGRTRFLPMNPDLAWQVRMWDRFFDHYVHEPMQKIVTDRLRPEGGNDAFGVEQAKAQLREAYPVLERELDGKIWMLGDAFTMAECAAAPALFYANTVIPFEDTHKRLTAYLNRLIERPSFMRVLSEAEPYFAMFPMDKKPEFRGRSRAAET